MPRLQAIDRPQNLKMRLAYWMTQRRFGKVISPMKIAYARVPGALALGYRMGKFVESDMKLEPQLKFLVQTLVSSINDCAFCVDFAQHRASRMTAQLAKARSIRSYATHADFTARERAALSYAEEATVNKRVSDDTFATVREHFNEREIVELTMLIAIDNYYNLINIPLEIESDGFCSLPIGLNTKESAETRV